MVFFHWIFSSENGNISELSRANVWFVIDDIVVTPIGNNLRGITRKNLHLAIGSQFQVIY